MSNGTAAGTVLVTDINPGIAGSYPMFLTNVNGTLFFDATNGVSGRELWKSNGTAAGTVLVKDINPGSASSYPTSLTNVNGTLFFAANNGVSTNELWKSNGTAAGTALVKDIAPGIANAYPRYLTNVNGTLFFRADDGVHGNEPWVLGPVPVSAPAAVAPVLSPAAFAGVSSGFLPDTGTAGLRPRTAPDRHFSALESGDTAARGRLLLEDSLSMETRATESVQRSPAVLEPKSQPDESVVLWSQEPANDPLAPFKRV
jgi:ELWxxDGT repeat protein